MLYPFKVVLFNGAAGITLAIESNPLLPYGHKVRLIGLSYYLMFDNMTKGNWDKGLDYEKTKKLLMQRLKELRLVFGIRSGRALAYTCALLTQLRNGSRVSEAVDAVRLWVTQKKREVEVRVRKHRKPEMRKMIIPEELKEEDRLRVLPFLNYLTPSNVKVYAKSSLGFNTHSLRYARITHLARKGVSPSLIAKITHHKRLDYILHYTEQKAADEINRQIT